MLLLVLDTETTGLKPEEGHEITELAWAVFDTESRQAISCGSFMFPHEEVPEEITKITGIDARMTGLLSTTMSEVKAHGLFQAHMAACHAVVAHNAEFDRKFARAGGLDEHQKPWVCSYVDLDLGTKPGKLTHMCTDHGIPVSGAHRAINDVLMLCQLLATCDTLEEQIESILTKKRFYVIANVTYATNQLAKDAGFKWDPVKKVWWKNVRADSDLDVHDMFGFRVNVKEEPAT